MKLWRVLHAGWVLEAGNHKILFDPIFENPFSTNAFAFPEVQFNRELIRRERFDAVFISHFHDDHFSLTSLDLLDRSTPIYAFSIHDEMFELILKLGFSRVYSLQLNAPISCGAITVTPLRALEADTDSIFHINCEELNILNVVDAWIDDETLMQLASVDWDLVIWPFQTMREIEVLSPSRFPPADRNVPEECLQQLHSLRPRRIVPGSCQFRMENWSWYNHHFFSTSYAAFAEQVKKLLPDSQVIRVEPGQGLRFRGGEPEFLAPLSFVTLLSEATTDYNYNVEVKVPHVSEIALHFQELEPEKKRQVHNYLENEIPEKFAELVPVESDTFFGKNRKWQLDVYDRDGKLCRYYFSVSANKLRRISAADGGEVQWRTEVILSKLWSAIHCGEALTSMYLRINDLRFSDAVEADLETCSLMEDPLVRCLYEGNIFSFQKFQLRILEQKN